MYNTRSTARTVAVARSLVPRRIAGLLLGDVTARRRRTASVCVVVCVFTACGAAGDFVPESVAARSSVPAARAIISASSPAASPAPIRRRSLSWGPVRQIAGRVGAPVAVQLPDGSSMVVWGGPHRFLSRQARPGRRWRPAQAVPGTDGFGNIWGAGVDRDGTVTIVWDDENGLNGDYRILAARHVADRGWSRPAVLGTGENYDVPLWSGDFAVSPSGAVVVTWGEGDGDRNRAVYRAPDGGWTEPVTLPGQLWPNIPLAAIATDGVATVAYQHVGGHIALVQGSASGWSKPILLPATGSDFGVAAGRRSELVVMWQTSWRSIRTGRFDHGTWRERRLVGPRKADVVGVAAAADGSATFVWQLGGYGSARSKLVAVHQRRSGVIGPRAVVASGSICDYEMTANRGGDVLLAWTVLSEFRDAVPVRVAYRGRGRSPWSEPLTLGLAEDECVPAAALAPNGSAVVAWPRPKKLLARRAVVN